MPTFFDSAADAADASESLRGLAHTSRSHAGIGHGEHRRLQIDPETIEAVSAMIHARLDEMMAEGAAELADLASHATQLEGAQQKLLQAHYAGAIPLDLLKREQDRITASLETIE